MMRPRVLILDSNSLYSPNDRKLINPRVEQQLSECRKLCELDVYVPRIVLSELAYRKCLSSERLLAKAQNASAGLAQVLKLEDTPQTGTIPPIRYNLYRQYLKWCKQNTVGLAALPISKVDWKFLVTSAVQRRPPFSDGESEKGFRDSLIFQSSLMVAHSRPEHQLTLVTNDDRLREAVEDKTNWSLARNLDEFLSALKLEHSNVAAKRFDIFITEASRVFFDAGNQGCLFYRANVLGVIHRMFANQLDEIPELNVLENLVYFPDMATLERYGADVAVVGPSLYQGTETSDRHTWNATVAILTLFEAQTKHVSSLCHDFLRRTVFNVVWCAFVSEDGQFSLEAVKDVEFMSSVMKRATVFDLTENGFPTRIERLSHLAKTRIPIRVIAQPSSLPDYSALIS